MQQSFGRRWLWVTASRAANIYICEMPLPYPVFELRIPRCRSRFAEVDEPEIPNSERWSPCIPRKSLLTNPC